MPKVSVIIPIYGVEKFIERCAVSLFEQTLNDIEYIFVDDCTPDKSIEILESIIEKYRLRFAEENKVVRIVKMPTNSGLPAVRRHGIQLATGDYIIHCDSDDWVDTDMYRAMYEKAVADNADLVACDYFESDGSDSVVVREYVPKNNADFFRSVLIKTTHSAVWNKMVRKSLYDNKNFLYPVGNNAEDHLFVSQLSYYSKVISYVDKPLYYYFSNPGSMTHIKDIDWIISRFEQGYKNKMQLQTFMKTENILDQYQNEFDVAVATSKFLLVPYMSDKRVRQLWASSFPELFPRIITNRLLSLRCKAKYALVQIGLHRIM